MTFSQLHGVPLVALFLLAVSLLVPVDAAAFLGLDKLRLSQEAGTEVTATATHHAHHMVTALKDIDDLARGESASERPAFVRGTKPTNVGQRTPVSEPQGKGRLKAEDAVLTSGDAVLNFLANQTAKRDISWTAAELLTEFDLGKGAAELVPIASVLHKVVQLEDELQEHLTDLQLTVQYEDALAPHQWAIDLIEDIQADLLELSHGPQQVMSADARSRKVQVLKDKVLGLHTGKGVIQALQSINVMLVGGERLRDGQHGLIDIFIDHCFLLHERYHLTTSEAPHAGTAINATRYVSALLEWHHAILLLQYMGLAQLANVRLLDKDVKLLKEEMERQLTLPNGMKAQAGKIWDAIPDFAYSREDSKRLQPYSLFDDAWYLIRLVDPDRRALVMSAGPLVSADGHLWSNQVAFVTERPGRRCNQVWKFHKDESQEGQFILQGRSGLPFLTDNPEYVVFYPPRTDQQFFAVDISWVAARDAARLELVLERRRGARPDAPLRESLVWSLKLASVGRMIGVEGLQNEAHVGTDPSVQAARGVKGHGFGIEIEALPYRDAMELMECIP